MDIEAVVDSEVIKVGSIIPEQYTLKKLWDDIKDMMYEKPIRYAEKVKFRVMLPWQNSEEVLHNDSELQAAFKQLRDKSYAWAMFIIRTELDSEATIRKELENYVDAARDYGFRSPIEQFHVSLDK